MQRQTPASSDFFVRERGTRRKKWKGRLPIALIFPNFYELGMSNLGFQLIYDLLNQYDGLVCERVFLPARAGDVPRSVESGRSLSDFPLLFCSMSFEHDFLNLAKIFALSGIAPLADERSDTFNPKKKGQPLIIGGGVITFINPEPIAPFFDAIIIGEAEPVFPLLMEYLLTHLDGGDKESLLKGMAEKIPGCYVPRFYTMKYGTQGTLEAIEAADGLPRRVKKVTMSSCETASHSRLFSPDAEFANLFLTELGRGCSRGCRFCAAGFVYRPPRLWDAASILKALAQRPIDIERVGLLGMEMARHDDLVKISDFLLEEGCALSFSSLRADALCDELCQLLQKSGPKTLAIAPDGASQRLRQVINKGISENDVLAAAEALATAGVANIKLYVMVGLPTETMDDLEEFVKLALHVKSILLRVGRPKGRLSNMTLSVNCFVPKAWTPFQYHPFAQLKELKDKIKYLKMTIGKEPNIRITAEHPGVAHFQAVMARGDRRVGKVLAEIALNNLNWRQAMKKAGIDPEFYAMRERDRDEVFPWEVIDHGISRNYLWSEYQKALRASTTSPCDTSTCRRCGVCHD